MTPAGRAGRPSREETPIPTELHTTRRFGLGLRAQIIVALSTAFIISFTLLGIAAVRLTERARQLDRRGGAQATVHAIAAAMDTSPDNPLGLAEEMSEAAIGHGGIAGVELAWPGLEPRVRGVVGAGDLAEAPLRNGGAVRVWVRSADAAAAAPVTDLLLLYVAVTGGAILLLAFVALTYLIVRPVSALTLASERLAAGKPVSVPVRGAAEVARLAVSFNAMATQLRAEREALERRLRELEKTTLELESAQEQLVRSERLASVGRLAAGVAHEIGNPLSAILGFVELLQGGELEEEEQAEFLRRIHGETQRIHQIIRNLLDFSRQGRDEEAREQSSDLAKVVEDAASLVAPQKDLGQVDIERRIAPDLPAVRGSADSLTQLVLNLLLNAADAIGGDGAITIEVEAHTDGEHVRFAVTDSGSGIDPKILPHIFEPFVTTKAAGQGTGLGLAVCHTIVEGLGGTIRAENSEHGGACFEVLIPRADRRTGP